ncbi:MAG TPA: hypothetical protein VMT79_12110 [Candidatus Binatia bacterium]|nr:hypothetical protein [Candidatus Binatia bacterium]
MVVRTIRTVVDLGDTLRTHLCRVSRWMLPDDDNPEVDRVIERLFARRDGLGPDETPARVADYLAQAAWPLERLQSLGLQVVAVLARGRYVLDIRRGEASTSLPAMSVVTYVVAPAPCYFRLERPDLSGPVHRLGAACPRGHRPIVSNPMDRPDCWVFGIWLSHHALAHDFERSIPWCRVCLRADRLSPDTMHRT